MKKSLFLGVILLILTSGLGAATKVADDPTHINVGARPLGLGKAFVAAANDINSIFLNPAGLNNIKSWQATSLSGRFLEEVNYFILGAALPIKGGVFGIGYTGSNLGFTTVSVTIEGGRVVTSTAESGSYADLDTILSFSYGTALNNIIEWAFLKPWNIGATLKMFSKELSARGTGYAASGYDLDLGLQYDSQDAFKFGLVAQNILPSKYGGKVVWNTGLVETLPATIKPAISLKLLGEKGLRSLDQHELDLNFDMEYYPTRAHLPNLFHLGLEWSPMRLLDLRFGIDQDHIGEGSGRLTVANNLAAGVGLNFGWFRFDYAYHDFQATPGIGNHFFSLTYGIEPRPEPTREVSLQPATTTTTVTSTSSTTLTSTTFSASSTKATTTTTVKKPVKAQVAAIKPVKPKIEKPSPKVKRPSVITTTVKQFSSTTTTIKKIIKAKPEVEVDEVPKVEKVKKPIKRLSRPEAMKYKKETTQFKTLVIAGILMLISVGLYGLWLIRRR